MEEPAARLPALAVDPERGGIGRLGDEVVAPHVVAVPPPRLDALGAGDEDERAVAGVRLRIHLVERLSARLGQEAVHGLAPRAEHRPERAWQATAPGAAAGKAAQKASPITWKTYPLCSSIAWRKRAW